MKPNLLSKFSVNREPGGPSINIWPESLPGFREIVSEYHARVEALGRELLPAWAVSLDLAPEWFDRFFEAPHVTLSMLHYPPQAEVGNRQYGIAPHTDNSFMTLLAQSNVGGLAVRMPSGHWRMVDKIPGTFLVNTGNLMVRWTNGRYLSTKHVSSTPPMLIAILFRFSSGLVQMPSSNACRRVVGRIIPQSSNQSPIAI